MTSAMNLMSDKTMSIMTLRSGKKVLRRVKATKGN